MVRPQKVQLSSGKRPMALLLEMREGLNFTLAELTAVEEGQLEKALTSLSTLNSL